MKKLISLYTIVLIVFIISTLAAALPFETDANPPNDNMREWSMWTKAICNEENYCIDIQITCEGDKIVGLKPISEGIYFSGRWEDSRSEEFRNKLC